MINDFIFFDYSAVKRLFGSRRFKLTSKMYINLSTIIELEKNLSRKNRYILNKIYESKIQIVNQKTDYAAISYLDKFIVPDNITLITGLVSLAYEVNTNILGNDSIVYVK